MEPQADEASSMTELRHLALLITGTIATVPISMWLIERLTRPA